MKPPPFDYLAPGTVEEALSALRTPGSLVLAGGQSLLMQLSFREVRPTLVVDINRLGELAGLTADHRELRIGALVRHRALETEPAGSSAPLTRLLSRAAHYVAHPPIRNRGTFCGSVAWAHPAAEWNAIVAGLAGTVHLRSDGGVRTVPAADWFTARLMTSRRPDELVTAVSLPQPPAGSGVGFAETRRTHASFADIAAAVVLTADGGLVQQARIGLAGVADVPVCASDQAAALAGVQLSSAAARVREFSRRPISAPGRRPADEYVSAVATELLARAVEQAVTEIGTDRAAPDGQREDEA